MTDRERFRKEALTNILRPGVRQLVDHLANDTSFFTDPASTRFHMSCEGGLVAHSLHVYDRLKVLSVAYCMEYSYETIAVVSLFHDICKTGCYVPFTRNVKTYDTEKVEAAPSYMRKSDNQGTFIWEPVQGYQFNDPFPYGHGEKSVYMIQKYMYLTDEEAMAIRWHMGFGDLNFKAGGYDVGNAFNKFPLAVLLHMADMSATYFDEGEGVTGN